MRSASWSYWPLTLCYALLEEGRSPRATVVTADSSNSLHSLKMMVECEGTLHILHNDDWVSTTSVFKTTLIYLFISGQITIRNKILFYVVKP